MDVILTWSFGQYMAGYADLKYIVIDVLKFLDLIILNVLERLNCCTEIVPLLWVSTTCVVTFAISKQQICLLRIKARYF